MVRSWAPVRGMMDEVLVTQSLSLMCQDPELYSWETTGFKPADDASEEGGIGSAAELEKREVPGKPRQARISNLFEFRTELMY